MRRHISFYLILGALLAVALLSSSRVAKAVPPDVAGYALSVSPNPVNRLTPMTISWTKPAGAGYGFIGIYDSTTVGPYGYIDFTYPTPVGNSGVATILAPDDPGGYWVGWVSADDGQLKTMSFFVVQLQLSNALVTLPGYSLTVPALPYGPGDAITVSWTKPAGSPLGYIGIWDTDEDGHPGGGPQEGVENFLDFRYATGGDSGTVTFVAPDEPGGYWFAWVSDAGYKAFASFAVVGEGGGGAPPPPPDTTAPTVSLTAPGNGANVSGSAVTVSANADDNVGVAGVQFQLDGANLGAELQSSPYSMTWDTTTAPNGLHSLTAIARDAAGNQATSAAVSVNVNNVVTPPGPFAKNGPPSGVGGQAHVPILSWGASSNATSYEYCVDTINNNICDTSWISTPSTIVAATGLSSGTTYFWQVRARNGAQIQLADGGAWWTFTTILSSHVNVASAANGGTASASSTYSAGYAPASAINGDRKGLGWGAGGGWNDGTESMFPDWLEVDFAGPRTIDEVDLYTLQDDYNNPVEPALGMPFTSWGITAFQAQYWDGLSWNIIPGGNITGNNQVWRQIQFGAMTTTKIRIYVLGALGSFSRITEVEAYSDMNVLPGALAKSSPVNGAAGQSVNPTLSWGASSGADSYEYCVDTINNNSCDTSWTSTANTNAAVHGLTAGTTYFWQVRARNGAGTTDADAGAWWSFATVSGGHLNVAAAVNGGIASASSFFNSGYAPSGANNGDRKGSGWGSGGGWNDATENAFPDALQVAFAGPQTIDEVDVFTLQDNYTNPAEPTLGMTFTSWGITAFQVQSWDGANWVTVPGGNITGNNQVWRQITFAPLTTSQIRILVTDALGAYSRITEVEAYTDVSAVPGPVSKLGPVNGSAAQPLSPTLSWTASSGATSYEYCVDTINNNICDTSWTSTPLTNPGVGGLSEGTYFWQVRARNNTGVTVADGGTWWSFTTSSAVVNPAADVASAANGATVSASSVFSAAYPAGAVIDGDRKGVSWGNGGGWNDATLNQFPDSIQINFANAKTIGEVDVFTLQDNFGAPVNPTPAMTFSQYGITDFQVQYWDGSNWVTVPNGSISGNTLVWRRITFSPLTTTAIRITVTGALDSYSRITEVEAY